MANDSNQFSYFKVHSEYSICEGAIKIDDLAAKLVKNIKLNQLDYVMGFNLCGALEFAEKISKSGSHPIIGHKLILNLVTI